MVGCFEALGRLARGLASLLPPCPVHTFLGIPCPSCGTTRAIIALVEGRWLDALLYNPLIIGGGGLFLGYIAIGLVIYARTGCFPEPHFSRRGLWFLRVALVGSVLVNWWWLIHHGV